MMSCSWMNMLCRRFSSFRCDRGSFENTPLSVSHETPNNFGFQFKLTLLTTYAGKTCHARRDAFVSKSSTMCCTRR
ncbi:hypothetical protein ANTPLA_LOCUS3326 [Anthophora plagiata]